ncbi:MAG: HdeD family acid-resistance protein [Anaerovoracaceae bacterium]
MRVLQIAAGVILILTGVFCFANPGVSFLSMAFILGIAMMLSGIMGILEYYGNIKNETSSLILVEGITSSILGFLVLLNQLLVDAAIPVFFGMWVMFSGILRVAEAYSVRKSDLTKWQLFIVVGIAGISIGIYSFFNVVLFAFSIVVLVGILFVMQGINVLMVGLNLSAYSQHVMKLQNKI